MIVNFFNQLHLNNNAWQGMTLLLNSWQPLAKRSFATNYYTAANIWKQLL